MADKQNNSDKTLDRLLDKFLTRPHSRQNDSRYPSPESRRSGWIRRVRSSLRRPAQLRPAPPTRPLASSTRPLPPWTRLLRPPKHKTTLLRLITNPPPLETLPNPNPIFIDPRLPYTPPRTPHDLLLLHLLGRSPDPRPEIPRSPMPRSPMPRSPSAHYLSPRSTAYFTHLAAYLSLPPTLPAPIIVYCLLTRWPAVRRHLGSACPWLAAYELCMDWTGVEQDPWTEVVSGGGGMAGALGAWVKRREVLFLGPDPAVRSARRRTVPMWTIKRVRVMRDWERRRRGPEWAARVWGGVNWRGRFGLLASR